MNFFNLHTHSPQPDSLLNCYPQEDEPETNFSVGFHPLFLETQKIELFWDNFILKTQNPFCKAIGECGLDRRSKTDFQTQFSIFQKQIAIAESQNKPLIIHCVQSFDVLIPIIKKTKQNIIIHAFNQNESIHHQLLKIDTVYFSFGKALMLENSNAIAQIQITPLEKLFLETDDSQFEIEEIYHKAAKLLRVSLDKLQTQILNNRKLILGI